MSKKWGIKVNRTTVNGILSKKDAVEAAIKTGIPSKRKKLKPAQQSKLDDEVTVEAETILLENSQETWSTVRKFMQHKSGNLVVLQACDRLENKMHKIAKKTLYIYCSRLSFCL